MNCFFVVRSLTTIVHIPEVAGLSTIETNIRSPAWIVSEHQMLAAPHRQTFRAHGRGHDGLSHRHRLEDLEPRAAADSERDDVHRCVLHVRPNVFDAAGDSYCRILRQPRDGGGRRSADD